MIRFDWIQSRSSGASLAAPLGESGCANCRRDRQIFPSVPPQQTKSAASRHGLEPRTSASARRVSGSCSANRNLAAMERCPDWRSGICRPHGPRDGLRSGCADVASVTAGNVTVKGAPASAAYAVSDAESRREQARFSPNRAIRNGKGARHAAGGLSTKTPGTQGGPAGSPTRKRPDRCRPLGGCCCRHFPADGAPDSPGDSGRRRLLASAANGIPTIHAPLNRVLLALGLGLSRAETPAEKLPGFRLRSTITTSSGSTRSRASRVWVIAWRPPSNAASPGLAASRAPDGNFATPCCVAGNHDELASGQTGAM